MTAASNSEARKRQAEANQAASVQKSPLSRPNSPNATGDVSGAESGSEEEVGPGCDCGCRHVSALNVPGVQGANGAQAANLTLACSCGHDVQWHHESRGCGWFGFSDRDRCPCRLTSNECVAAIVREHRAEVLAEVERRIEARLGVTSRALRIVRDYRQEARDGRM